MMDKYQKFEKFIPWLVWMVSLINAIWLILIPGDVGISSFNVFIQKLLPLVFLLLPGIALLVIRSIRGQTVVEKYSLSIKKTTSILAFWILLVSGFLLLMPFARFRLTLARETWWMWLPVVLSYTLSPLLWFLHKWLELRNLPIIPSKANHREVFIDFARGFAIVLAVGSHAFYAFGYDVLFGNSMYQIMSITRFATPSFILITGMMFELVYLRKAEKHGFQVMVQSLLSRALQCYLAFGVTVFIEWFNQQLNSADAQLAVVFMGNSLFSGILQFYTLFLLLAIPMIWLRKRFGIWLITAVPILVWLGDFFLDRMSWPAAEQPLSHLTALLFGHPAVSNFSLWHALTFMAFGMLVGHMFKRSRAAANWQAFQTTLLVLFLLCLAVSLVFVLSTTWGDFYYDFSNEYRINHQISYYSIGSMGALLLLWITWKLRRFLTHPWLDFTITTLGKDSLWAFAVGNSLAAVLPALTSQSWFVVLFVLAVLGGSVGVIHVKKLSALSFQP